MATQNRFGIGEFCKGVKVTTLGPPPKPDHPVLLKRSQQTLKLLWHSRKDATYSLEWDSGSQGNQWTSTPPEWSEGKEKRETLAQGLTPLTGYRFRVAASNEYGTTYSKELSDMTVEGLLTTPELIKDRPMITFTGTTFVSLKWTSLLFGDFKALNFYSILFRPSESETWKSKLVTPLKGQETFEVTVEDLLPGVEYELLVQAVAKDRSIEKSESVEIKTLSEGKEGNEMTERNESLCQFSPDH